MQRWYGVHPSVLGHPEAIFIKGRACRVRFAANGVGVCVSARVWVVALPRQSGYSHYGRGPATAVGVYLRSGFRSGRGYTTVAGVVGGAALRWRVGDQMSGSGRICRGPRRARDSLAPATATPPTPTPTRQRSAAQDPTRTPTVGRPRPSWQYPDCCSCTPTVVAVPRPRPRPHSPDHRSYGSCSSKAATTTASSTGTAQRPSAASISPSARGNA